MAGTLARDARRLWTAEGITLAAMAIQGVIVARLLGPNRYGIAALVMSYPGVVLALLDAYSVQATVRYLARFSESGDVRRAAAVVHWGFAIDALVGFVALCFVAISSPWAESVIVKSPGVQLLLIVYSVGLILRSPANTSAATLIFLKRVRLLAVVRSSTGLARAMLVAALALWKGDVTTVVFAVAGGLALEGFVLLLAAYPEARRSFGRHSFADSWRALEGYRREIMRFILWSDIGSFFGAVVKQFDVLILGTVSGATQVGYYRLGRSIASLGGSIVGPLQSLIYPRLAVLIESGPRAELRSLLRKLMVRVALPLSLSALAAALLVPTIIRNVAGPAYDPAAFMTQLLVAGSAVWIFFFWVRPLVLAIGGVKFWALNFAVTAILAVVGFVLVAPSWGGSGMASVQLVVTAITTHLIAIYYLSRRRMLFST